MKTTYLITSTLLFLICFGCHGAEKKEIKASEIIKLVQTGKPVQLVNKIIIDDLDFTADSKPFALNANMFRCEVQSSIYFEGCVFLGRVTSNGKRGKTQVQTCFRNNLTFVDCDFRGEVDFDGAVVFGMINFGRSVFRENVSFNNMAVWAKDSYFSEMKVEKDFMMIYTAFSGNLFLPDAVFNGNASFQETSVKGKLIFNNCIFAERAGFDLMEVYGSAFFNYAKFVKTADFSSSRFMFTADFVQTDFGSQANFEKASFMHKVNFEEVDRSRLILTDTYFAIEQKYY